MRDNLLSAKKLVNRAGSRTVALRALHAGKRASVFIIAATLVVVTTLGFITVRALTGGFNNKPAEDNAMTTPDNTVKGSSATSITSTSNQPGGSQQTQSQVTTNSSNRGASTSMNVNGHQIDIPQNGSVSKTFTDDNGTTHVNVSSNTSQSGNSTSSSVSSTSINSSTNSFSQNVTVNGNSVTSQ